MLLVLSSVVMLYFACFLWFRSLCRAAIRSHESSIKQMQTSNLIPFERGMKLQVHKTSRAI